MLGFVNKTIGNLLFGRLLGYHENFVEVCLGTSFVTSGRYTHIYKRLFVEFDFLKVVPRHKISHHLESTGYHL
jgi:hypothetical protein